MDKIPTAEEEINEILRALGISIHKDLKNCIIDAIQHTAKLHVTAALKAAAEKAYFRDFNDFVCHSDENKKSILNAYPLENIK